jgi:1,4-dihydroxy-6-naphthoate synthase
MSTGERPVLRLGHSPDPDDAFMWWPLLDRGEGPRIDTGRFRFEAVTDDIESLNRRSSTAELEITAMSCAQYPHVSELYAVTACGASMGDAYGPKLVAREAVTMDSLRESGGPIAVPGRRTSAFGALSLILGTGGFRYEEVPFDRIIEAVAAREYDAGLVIHEGQLTYESSGLCLLVDVGAWWTGHHHCPLPLGLNTIRRDLDQRFGAGTLPEVTATLLRSVEYALDHRAESIAYALNFARDMGAELADSFIQLYVNQWTLDFGPTGTEAVRRFLDALHTAGVCPDPGPIDVVPVA